MRLIVGNVYVCTAISPNYRQLQKALIKVRCTAVKGQFSLCINCSQLLNSELKSMYYLIYSTITISRDWCLKNPFQAKFFDV